MKKQMNWLVVVILILGLAGLACNAILGDDGAEPTADVTLNEPVATVATGGETGGESGGDSGGTAPGNAAPTLDLNPGNNFGVPSDVNSFRISIDMQFEETMADGTVESGHIIGTGAQVIEPFAMMFDFTIEGSDVDVDFGGGGFSMTQIGDTTYINLGDTGCISTSNNEVSQFPLTDFTTSESFLGGLQGAELVEENVTINGIQTNHYHFTDSALTQGEQALGTLQNVDGNVYVSAADGYVVRITMEADGQSFGLAGADATGGHINYQIDYSDFNAPIEITAPEGCAGGEDTEFPILEDATNVNSLAGLVSYNTNTTYEDIVEFYKTEMEAAGYTLTSDFSTPPTAFLTFELDGQEVTVSVAENPAGGGFVVTIIKG
jgi:hypothetical protein